MEPTTAPPPLSAVTTTGKPISDSLNSSKTSVHPPSPAPAKLRLMCSYGGHIVPRPHDKTLCYVGGDTRIVAVDRHTSLSDLTNRLAKTLTRSSNQSNPFQTSLFVIKYQLPSEDLDSLITISNDEDLENMIDEYDRLNSNLNINSKSSSSRIRLFLFPNKPDSVTSIASIGSLLETTNKSDDWFLNALNGTSSGFSDTSSINCLLGLEDEGFIQNFNNNNNTNNNNNNQSVHIHHVNSKILGGNNRSVQDVQSVPDSPMLENSSSFGSASSGNLPPIRVNEEQKDVNFAVSAPVLVTSEDMKAVVLEEERSEQGIQIGQIKQQQYERKPSIGIDIASPDSVSSDCSVTNPLSRRKPPVIYQDPSNNYDQNTRTQVQDSGYVVPTTPTTQVDPQHPQPHNQPQFIHTAVPPPQYQMYPPGAIPIASYYHMYPPQSQSQSQTLAPLDQHNFVYYMPARPPIQGYNIQLQPDPAASAPPSNQVPPPSSLFTTPRAPKTEPPAGAYRTVTSSGALPTQLVQLPSSQHPMQPQFVGYSQQGQHVYYAAQPLPPQSAPQFQTVPSPLPAETQAGNGSSNLQADNSLKQQVRTSQP